MNVINIALWFIEEVGITAVIAFCLFLYLRYEFKAVKAELRSNKEQIEKHEKQCDKWRDRVTDTIDKIKDKVTKIEIEAGLEKRLSELEKK